MIRRILSTVIETAYEPTTYQSPFTRKETLHFEWLCNISPCFPINAQNIKILTEPQQFYNILLNKCSTAKERITLVSLYLGTGSLEKNLVDAVRSNENFTKNRLKVNVLIDYMRGSRYKNNSRTMLQPLLENNAKVSLYHTPRLRGLLKRVVPERANEVFGLQHMKLYIFDDTLIISGANLSCDYFTNRQDRYFVINDKSLCDFYCKLVNCVQQFSLELDTNNTVRMAAGWPHSPYEGNRRAFIDAAHDVIEDLVERTKSDLNSHKSAGFDTWLFPMVQMGQLDIHYDSVITNRILAEAPEESELKIATGYFNLTNLYMKTLVRDCKGRCDILMAHPKANGFLGTAGLAGGIPYAYSLIAQQFKEYFTKNKQQKRIELQEYERDGWTYHSKGLWYYPPGWKAPCLTLIGSPNFGERSVRKDLETQLAIVTENSDFQNKLQAEVDRLYKRGSKAEVERDVPLWVRLFVFAFRRFF